MFTSDLKKTIFHTFHDIAQFLLSVLHWQRVVIISLDSQYYAIRKLKCHCTKSHRIFNRYILTKGIYMDNGQLELGSTLIKIWGFPFQILKNAMLLLIYDVDHRPVLVLLLINQYSYSYSCNNQVSIIVLVLTHITSSRTRTCTRKSGTHPSPDSCTIDLILEELKIWGQLDIKKSGARYASPALSILLSDWDIPNLHNNK